MDIDKIFEYYHAGITERGGCGGPVMFALILALFLLCSCKTVTNTESYVEKHRIESMMAKMDSVISKSSTTVQDSTWRETVIMELQSIREKSDTNHIVVVDSAGRVIKETVVINNTREVVSEKDRQEREVMMHKIERLDSVISIQNEQISRIDSLLQQSQKEKTIEKKQSWWQKAWQQSKGMLIGVVITLIVLLILRLKKTLI